MLINYNALKKYFRKFFSINTPVCRIEKIDHSKRVAVIHFVGICSPATLSFEEIISDLVIISNLSPLQASWIGYYYGLYQYPFEGSQIKPSSCFDLFHNSDSVRYKIISLDRKGSICMVDKVTNVQKNYYPIAILKDKNMIENLTSEVACYIGILAGIHSCKVKLQRKRSVSETAKLKLVK